LTVPALSRAQKDVLGLIFRAQVGDLSESEEKEVGRRPRRLSPFLTQTQVANMQKRKIGAVGKDFRVLRTNGFISPTFDGADNDGLYLKRKLRKEYGLGSDNPYCLTRKGYSYINVEMLIRELEELRSQELGLEDFHQKERKILTRRIAVLERTDVASTYFKTMFKSGIDPGLAFLEGELLANANAGNLSSLMLLNSREWGSLRDLHRAHGHFLNGGKFQDIVQRMPMSGETSFLAAQSTVLITHAKRCRGCSLSGVA